MEIEEIEPKTEIETITMSEINMELLHYIEAIGDKIKLHYKDTSYVVNKPLSYFESKMSNSQFLKVHPNYIVNLNMINKFEGNKLYLRDKKIPVGPELVKDLQIFLISSALTL